MTVTRLLNVSCPACKAVIDAATAVESGTTPSHGDFTVCYGCKMILAFDRFMPNGLRMAGDDEIQAHAKQEPEINEKVSNAVLMTSVVAQYLESPSQYGTHLNSPKNLYCRKCQQPKSANAFPRKRKAKSGRSAWCKACHKTHSKVWSLKDDEKRKEKE